MKLPKEETELFYKLNWSLLFYVNQKYTAIQGLSVPDFKNRDLKKIFKLHESLYSHLELIDSFVAENPFKFNQEELTIIESWKNFIRDKFIIISNLKDYTVFLQQDKDPKAYGVLGLYDEIEIFTPYLPELVETVLLPFKGKIIYCGIIQPYRIHFGPGIRRTFQADYQKAKSRFGIILSLDAPLSAKKESDEELLRFYVKNEANRAEYCDEIDELLEKNPLLWKVYYQEIGRSNRRKAAKRFSQIGLASRWFAIFEDIIIASGQSPEEVKAQIEDILPEEKRDYVHIFRYVKK